MTIYISDSENDILSQVNTTIEELRKAVQERLVDDPTVDVVNNDNDWEDYCYGAGWSIYDELEVTNIEEYVPSFTDLYSKCGCE